MGTRPGDALNDAELIVHVGEQSVEVVYADKPSCSLRNGEIYIHSLSVKVLNFRKFILKNSIFLFKGFPLAAGQSAYATRMLLVIIVVL